MRHSGKSRWLYLSNVSTTPHPVCCLHRGAGHRHPCLHWSPASSPVGLFLPFSLSSVFSAAARVMRLLKTPSWLPLSKQTVLSGALDNPRDPCFPPHPHRPPCNAAEYASRALRGGCHASCLSPLLETLSPELGVARLLEIFAGLLAGGCGLPCARFAAAFSPPDGTCSPLIPAPPPAFCAALREDRGFLFNLPDPLL